MPAVSRQQYKFMKSVEEGKAKAPGLSKEKAHEFTEDMTKERFSKLKNKISKK